MKIGLVSYYSRNYGAILQGYALQEILQGLGHEVIAINRGWGDYGHLVWNFHYSFPQFLKKTLINYPFDDFVRKELRMSKPILSADDLKNISNSLDAVIAGSDQIWNVDTIKYMQHYFFLDWVDSSIPKYSYAASFGKDCFCTNTSEKLIIRDLLSQYKAISVREYSGIRICKDEFGMTASQHLDPTLLLSVDKYKELFRHIKKPAMPYFCTYLLDTFLKKESLINRLKISMRTERIDNYAQTVRFKQQLMHKSMRMPTVYQWLANIANSQFVITDSFHGTVFSIIFNKPFICLNNAERGSARFESLLGNLGLMDRLVDLDKIEYEGVLDLLNKKIDYTKVESKLDKLRVESLKYLKSIC